MPPTPDRHTEFAPRLIAWQKRHGRHDLPWQQTRDAYRIWLSEIMLQQTQVSTVVPYYQRFLAEFPTLADLAAAPLERVLELWAGLGYYARARNLHACAVKVMAEHGGQFPREAERIATLPGIGRSTAAAIAAFAYGERGAILDGNVKRVLTRCFGIDGFPGSPKVEKGLWQLAGDLLPHGPGEIEIYTQGIMDLGASLCSRSRPTCTICPMQDLCIACRDGRQEELPQGKPTKAVPLRQTTVVICSDGARLLLQRRPPAGIWGGLLALPEIAAPETPATLAATLGLHVQEETVLAPVRHTFTHFRLELTPVLLQVAPGETPLPAGLAWHPWSGLGTAALPAPLRKLLLSLAESSTS